MTLLFDTTTHSVAGERVSPAPAAHELTVLPARPSPNDAPQQRRTIGRLSRRDLQLMAGAGVSALCTTMLLFGRLTPLSGNLGFVVTAFALYLVTYAVLVSLTEKGPAVVDRVMTVLLTSAAVLALFALASVIIFTLWRGREALVKPNFYTQDMSLAGPLDPLEVGGVTHAIAGTLIMTAIALVLTVPLGLACAVYLNETGGRGAGLVRRAVSRHVPARR